MPATFEIPDYGVTIYGQPDRPKQIAVGATDVTVDGEKVEAGSTVVIDKAVRVQGAGAVVTTTSVEPEPPKPKPKPAAKKAPAKKKPAAKTPKKGKKK